MSEETQNTDQTNESENETQTTEAEELQVLKDRATKMGIKFSNNIKVETLRQKIEDKMEGNSEEEEEEEEESQEEPKAQVNPLDDTEVATKEMTPAQARMAKRQAILKKQTRLVRCRITNMDPKKKDLPGEIITVANELIGTVRKFIPFGEVTDEGYHIPYCLYKELESRRFLQIRQVRDKRTGTNTTKTRWAKEFALEVLPQLTQEELDRLANQQAASGSISDDD